MCNTAAYNPRDRFSKGAPPKPQNILGGNLTKNMKKFWVHPNHLCFVYFVLSNVFCLFGCLGCPETLKVEAAPWIPTSTASKIAASAALKAAWLQKPASDASCFPANVGRLPKDEVGQHFQRTQNGWQILDFLLGIKNRCWFWRSTARKWWMNI